MLSKGDKFILKAPLGEGSLSVHPGWNPVLSRYLGKLLSVRAIYKSVYPRGHHIVMCHEHPYPVNLNWCVKK